MPGSWHRFYHKHVRKRELFSYPTQALEEDQIRILNIHPSSGHERLRCTLETYPRSAAAPYKAISYVWGEPPLKDFVLVNGKALWIRQNLKDALYRIRRKDRSIRLWTDAICINQDDHSERSSQVQCMGQTYSQADEVLIWLGHAYTYPHALRDIRSNARTGHDVRPDDLRMRGLVLREVFAHPWFSRLWVFQEVFLARKCTVLLGDECCDLSSLFDPLKDWTHVLASLDLPWQDFQTLQLNLGNFLFLMHCMKNFPVLSTHSRPKRTLAEHVMGGRRRSCQDSRDHIFAFAGLAQQVESETVEVDYALTAREVYQNFMELALRQDSDALILFDDGCNEPRDADLPSWVPEFSRPSLAVPFVVTKSGFHNAGGAATKLQLSELSFVSNKSAMKLDGFRFDAVCAHQHIAQDTESTLHNLRKVPDGDVGTGLRAHCLVAENFWSTHRIDTSPYGDDHGNYEAGWRTMIGNVYQRYSSFEGTKVENVSASDDGTAYEIFMLRADFPSPTSSNGELVAYVDNAFAGLTCSLASVTGNRSLFVTTRGWFGVGPRGTASEDIVVVVPGLQLPIMLRKRPHGETYQLVGMAYVHGIMQGEFMESMSRTSNADIQTFVID